MTNNSQIADQAAFMALGLQRISGPHLAQAKRYLDQIVIDSGLRDSIMAYQAVED